MIVHLIARGSSGWHHISAHHSDDLLTTRHPEDNHLMLCDRSRPHPRTGQPSVVAWYSTFSILSGWVCNDAADYGFSEVMLVTPAVLLDGLYGGQIKPAGTLDF